MFSFRYFGCTGLLLATACADHRGVAATDGLAVELASAMAYPSCSAAASDMSRLTVALEIHVENQDLSTADETDYVLRIADAAANAGVPLSIALGVDFLRDYAGGAVITTTDHGDFTLDSLVDTLQGTYCHAVTLHADVPERMSRAAATAYLRPLVTAVNDAGGTGSVASGVCNEIASSGGWLRAAIDAGVTTVAGVVEDCQVSLDWATYPDDHRTAAECSPSRCHGAAPLDDPAQRAAGWFASQVSTWITPDEPVNAFELRTSIFIIGSFGEANAPCLAEQAAGVDVRFGCTGTVTLDDGRLDGLTYIGNVSEVVDASLSGGEGDAFHSAFSTNLVAGDEWLTGFFTEVASGLGSGTTLGGAALADVTQLGRLTDVATHNRAIGVP